MSSARYSLSSAALVRIRSLSPMGMLMVSLLSYAAMVLKRCERWVTALPHDSWRCRRTPTSARRPGPSPPLPEAIPALGPAMRRARKSPSSAARGQGLGASGRLPRSWLSSFRSSTPGGVGPNAPLRERLQRETPHFTAGCPRKLGLRELRRGRQHQVEGGGAVLVHDDVDAVRYGRRGYRRDGRLGVGDQQRTMLAVLRGLGQNPVPQVRWACSWSPSSFRMALYGLSGAPWDGPELAVVGSPARDPAGSPGTPLCKKSSKSNISSTYLSTVFLCNMMYHAIGGLILAPPCPGAAASQEGEGGFHGFRPAVP